MNQTTGKNQRAPKILASTDGEVYALHLVNGTAWSGTAVQGFPCAGLDDLDLGLMPERLREEATGANYAIKHYDTVIAFRLPSGTWRVPFVSLEESPERKGYKKTANYGVTTSGFRGNIIRALKSQGIIPDES